MRSLSTRGSGPLVLAEKDDFVSVDFAQREVQPIKGTKPMAGKARRTTHRSSKGTKLYAVRDKKGRFKDIQTYKRAHSADIKRKAKGEK